MAVVTGDQYLESLVKFVVENEAEKLIEGTLVLKLNPVGLRYVQSRLEALAELESLLAGAPVDYLRAYVSDLGDHRALEQLRRILGLLPSLKLVSVLPPPARDPTPLFLLPFARLKVLELQGCDLSTSAAKGLLELRFTLEKLICHNSTDALRHVFVSRIAEIKDSPQWNRLSFVSCAVNGLILMDESLQLLPVVETLDLSRNKFAKVDNLRKCTKLKHLDLGFNSLRSIASLREVSCQIVKLVLRNNALTTLRGIENMKSIQGLDLSYNIISNFSEIEILAGLPSLQNLWLEGNPLCCARWFRAQVFSFFSHPETLKLDDKRISASEFWNRQIIVASRQKQPSSFGFYSPAKDSDDLEGSINTKRVGNDRMKRISRLVSIEREDQGTYICSDQDSVSCDYEIQSKNENDTADEDAGIGDLIKRIECVKRECPVLWLQEFKEWMDKTSKGVAVGSNSRNRSLGRKKHVQLKTETKVDNLFETSRCIPDPVQLSGDESSTFFQESETSFADTSTVISTQLYSDRIGEASSRHFLDLGMGDVSVVRNLSINQDEPRLLNDEGRVSADTESPRFNPTSISGGDDVKLKDLASPSTLINNITGSSGPGSPPHYQEDILHRRHNLEEEFLQLSVESLSVASTESNTSCSEDDSAEFGPYLTHTDKSIFENVAGRFPASFQDRRGDVYHDSLVKQNGTHTLTAADGNFSHIEGEELGIPSDACSGSFNDVIHDGEIPGCHNGEIDGLEKKLHKRKVKRRMISLLGKEDGHGDTVTSKKSSDQEDICGIEIEHEGEGIPFSNDLLEIVPVQDSGDITALMRVGNFQRDSCLRSNTSFEGKNNSIGTFFNLYMADSNEAPMQHMECSCLLMEKSGYNEREVTVIRTSKCKLHILLITDSCDGSGTSFKIIGSHIVDDVRGVFVGLGVQTLRVYFEGNTSYLFITRCLGRSRELLSVLDIFDLSGIKDYCSITSLENIQINLFEEHICGGLKINLFQYSMVFFWHSNLKEDSWLSRSLFMLDEHLIVCTEDLMQFGPTENSFSSNYFDAVTYCAIANVSEMVIDTLDSLYVTLSIKCTSSEKGYSIENAFPFSKSSPVSGAFKWKLKWFSEESLLNFVALVKAIHAQVTSSSSLIVRCKS